MTSAKDQFRLPSDAGSGRGRLKEAPRHNEGETLATVGRRLIEAQEQERTWIARELHDNINQQIAVTAIKLDRLKQFLGASTTNVQTEIAEICESLHQLGKNIQALSHRLHSPKLDYLGLVPASRSFCDELSAQQHVQIEFSDANVPRRMPIEISLCLFRVLQEALQNAVRHSGVRRFKAELRAKSDEIQLTVHDDGVGFNAHDAMNGSGIGLFSMRERLQLVQGQLSIQSEKGRGTTILASAPLRAIDDRLSA